jgi:hypothetical protein
MAALEAAMMVKSLPVIPRRTSLSLGQLAVFQDEANLVSHDGVGYVAVTFRWDSIVQENGV